MAEIKSVGRVRINATEVELLKISDLVADPRNVKEHPEAQIRQIAASIEAYGFNDPVAVDQDNVIVEGHGRMMAGQHIGMSVVPVIRLRFDSDAERKAYAIAHNQIPTLSNMDQRKLAYEVDRLGVDESNEQSIGFTHEDRLFLDFEESQQSAGGGDTNRFMGGERIIKSTIGFDDQEQLIAWFNFVDWLREKYPEALTIADRLDAFMMDYRDAINDF